MSTQPKETYGLNLVPARAHVAQRPCPGCLAHACKAKRTYDGGLVDESEEPARRRQARALIGARLARGRGCVEAASSPRLLLAEHRGPSGAQEGGRADEEQQHDEEGVEVEQRRLRPRQAASAPRWVGWSGVLLRGAHHAAGCLQRAGAQVLHALQRRWRSGRNAFFNTKTASIPRARSRAVLEAFLREKCLQRKFRARTLRCYGCSAMLAAATSGCAHGGSTWPSWRHPMASRGCFCHPNRPRTCCAGMSAPA